MSIVLGTPTHTWSLYRGILDTVLSPEFVKRFFSFFWDLTAAMSRRRTGTDVIGNHKVKDVEALNGGRGLCSGNLIVLPTAGDVAVRGGKAYQMVRAEIFHARADLAAYRRQ